MPTAATDVRIGGRWRTGQSLAAPKGLERGEALAAQSEEADEWIGLDGRNAARPDLVAAFREIHLAVGDAPKCDALVVPLAVDGHRVVRRRLHDALASDVELPDSLDAVTCLVQTLWPAIRSTAFCLSAAIHPRDVAIDAEGFWVFAPSGLVTPKGRWAADPFRAPEAVQGVPTEAPALAFSLGVIIAALLQGKQPPPRAGLDFIREATSNDEVHALLIELTATETARRVEAIEALCAAPFLPKESMLPYLHAASPAALPPAPPKGDATSPGVLLVVSSEQLCVMEAPELSRLAVLSSIPLPFLQQCVADGSSVVVYSARGISEGKARRRLLESSSVRTTLVRDRGRTPTQPAGIAAVMAAGCVAGAASAVVFGPAIGAAAGAMGVVFGMGLRGILAGASQQPAAWAPPDGAEAHAALCAEVRGLLADGSVSTVGSVLLGEALADAERALVTKPHVAARTEASAKVLRRTLEHAMDAEQEVARVAERSDSGGAE